MISNEALQRLMTIKKAINIQIVEIPVSNLEIIKLDRNRVTFTKEEMSQFIEFLLIGGFLEGVKAKRRGGNYIVVSGLNQVVAVADFIQDKLTLEGLDILNELNGSRFSDFPEGLQKEFMSLSCRTQLIGC